LRLEKEEEERERQKLAAEMAAEVERIRLEEEAAEAARLAE